MSVPLRLSPRLTFGLRRPYLLEPWRYASLLFGGMAEFSWHDGESFCDLYCRLSGNKHWQYVMTLRSDAWRAAESTERVEFLMSFLDKVPPAGGASAAASPMEDQPFMKKFPAVAEFCWSTAWPDGTCRQPSTLTFFCEEGQWKVCLSERNREVSLWGSGRTFEDALNTLEQRLASDKPDWRKSKAARKR
jgi:hypothetical protein